MRTLGVVLGVGVLVLVAVLAFATVLSVSNETSWTELEAGECFDLAGAVADADGDLAAVFAVDTLDCDDPHDAEVVAVGELNPDGDLPYPSDDELFDQVDRECRSLVPVSVDPMTFGIVPIAPDESTWTDRNGRFACIAVVVGGGTVEGSALG